jgi:hypothetical protein
MVGKGVEVGRGVLVGAGPGVLLGVTVAMGSGIGKDWQAARTNIIHSQANFLVEFIRTL